LLYKQIPKENFSRDRVSPHLICVAIFVKSEFQNYYRTFTPTMDSHKTFLKRVKFSECSMGSGVESSSGNTIRI